VDALSWTNGGVWLLAAALISAVVAAARRRSSKDETAPPPADAAADRSPAPRPTMREALERAKQEADLNGLTGKARRDYVVDRTKVLRDTEEATPGSTVPAVAKADSSGGAHVHEGWYVPDDIDPVDRWVDHDGHLKLHLLAYPYREAGESAPVPPPLRLVEDETGLVLGPTNRHLPKVAVYVSKLRGTKYHRSGCKAGDFSPGAPVQLQAEPDNPYDPHAVAVLDATGTHKAAYLNKAKARTVGRLLGSGTALHAISLRGTPAGTACNAVTVLIASPEVVAHLQRGHEPHWHPPRFPTR